MAGKRKKASREKRAARGRKSGVGKPVGACATWWNQARMHEHKVEWSGTVATGMRGPVKP